MRIKRLQEDRYVSEGLLSLKVEQLPEGGYLATSDDLPGLVAQGRTLAETLEIAQDVARKLIESHLEHGEPLPSKIETIGDKPVQFKIPVGIS